jgi:hypothetical protein
LASGCVVAPHAYEERGYREDYQVYRETDSYEGYYYVRVVYINGDPWYVDEYRRARPIPRHLHSHFRHSKWTRSLPPRFSNDTVMRDGYHVSRIVYINDVPHHVDEDRRARPVPTRLRSRFAYGSVVPANDRGRRVGERPESPAYGRERERQEAPAFGRGRERNEQPAFGRGREREEQPAFGRGREREEQPVFVRGREREEQPAFVREREEQPAFVRGRERDEQPSYVRERAVMQERVREERGRGAPPFARNDRGAPGQMEVQPARGQAGDDRRPMAQGRNKERGRIEPVDDGRGRGGAASGNEQRTVSASGRQKEKAKGRGRDRDEEEDVGNGEGGRKHRGE